MNMATRNGVNNQLLFADWDVPETSPVTDNPLHIVSTNRNSSDAIEAILSLHFPGGSIVDATYGLGVFYKSVPDRDITGCDAKPTGDVVCDSRSMPFGDNEFSIGVCDPPYKRGDGEKYESRYGKAPKTETQVTRLYEDILRELLRVCEDGLIIKLQDGTDGHRFHARLFHLMQWMKDATSLDPHDICHLWRDGMPSTMVQGQPHFFKQAVSYFLVYRWRQKNPFKPVRF